MKAKQLILLLGAALLATACDKEPQPAPPGGKRDRTVIAYMVADNNLYSNAVKDINEMERGWHDNWNGYMVVYFYPVAKTSGYAPGTADYNENPRLLLIRYDNDNSRIVSEVLKEYDRASQNPCDAAVMTSVLNDAMALAPADHYGLVMWSHGSGWLPKGTTTNSIVKSASADESYGYSSKGAVPRSKLGDWLIPATVPVTASADSSGPIMLQSIGITNSNMNTTIGRADELDLDVMPSALPAGVNFDFILFDACFMASVEGIYELRDHAQYVIASSAETIDEGFPYDKAIGYMFTTTADVKNIAKTFYDDYNTRSGAWRSATISVTDCSKIDALAASIKVLCNNHPGTVKYTYQQFGQTNSSKFYNTFYDLGDFVRGTWSDAPAAADLAAFENALDAAVIYKAHTPMMFQGMTGGFAVTDATFCGITCYIPRPAPQQPQTKAAYNIRFGWSTVSGIGLLVP